MARNEERERAAVGKTRARERRQKQSVLGSVIKRGRAERTIVAADKCIAILGLELPVHILLRLLHRNVHVAFETREHA